MREPVDVAFPVSYGGHMTRRRDDGQLLPDNAPGLWPDPENGPFRIRLYWDVVDGRVECVGLELTSIKNPNMPSAIRPHTEPGFWSPPEWIPDPTPLTTSHLRDLHLSSLVSELREAMADSLRARTDTGALDRADTDSTEYQELAHRADESSPRRGRRPTYSRDHFRQVAEVYARAHLTGSNPRDAVAEWGTVSGSAAAKWIARAREYGFLESTDKGKAGGIPPALLDRVTQDLQDEGEEE